VKSFRETQTVSGLAKTVGAALRRDTLRLTAVWCALVIYVGVCSPLGFGAAALAGLLDRSHHISVDGGTEGLKLVLKHGRNCAPHRHGIVARALTFFARPASATNPDHVIPFTTFDISSRQLQFAPPRVADSVEVIFPPVELLSRSSCETPVAFVSTDPPRSARGQLLCLHSTLLLI
jgi:hypothetical protein